jgi:hypothetical protein
MIIEHRSNLLMCGGYPFLIMFPYKFLRYFFSLFVNLPPQVYINDWWATSEQWLINSKEITNDFSWISFFQHHDLILFQNIIELGGIYLGFLLIKKYFPYAVALLFLMLYALNPLSIEDGSSVRPEWLQSIFFILAIYLIDKIINAKKLQKKMLYCLFGISAALGFLIKFNGLIVYSILFVALLYFDHNKWKKTLLNFFICFSFFFITIQFFILSYHFPTTSSKNLSFNVWVLGDKVFQFIPKSTLNPKTGLVTKRILAIDKSLPDIPLPGAATFFDNINSSNERKKSEQVKASLKLLHSNENELDSYLQTHGYNPIITHTPLLKIPYYLGLAEYKSLITKLYFESIKKYPQSFFYHTMQKSARSFLSMENCFFYPDWALISAGINKSEPTKYGYARFLWPQIKTEAFVENIVWLPGAWFITKYFKFWPPILFYWLLSFISFGYSCKKFKSNNFRSLIIIISITISICFLIFHNIIYIDFRTKDIRGIMSFMILLASVGIYDIICFLNNKLIKYYNHLKIFDLKKNY